MAEAETETKVVMGTANGTCPIEDSGLLVGTGEAESVKEEAITVKKEEDKTGVKEMEEDSKENEKNEAVGKEEDHKLKEEVSKQEKEREEPELEDVKMEEETGAMEEKESIEIFENAEEKEEKESKENVVTAEEKESEESIDTREKEEKEGKESIENAEDNKDKTVKDKEGKGEKRSNKRGKGSNVGGKEVAKKNKVDEKNVKETNTPLASFLDRPVRERKSVERLVAFIEKDPAKDFHIEKGRGTPLKEIPNVAYKLSRKKTDEAFKSLYTILFGRRGKASDFKKNISQFSGFVWHESEEKQRTKLKEKFDKCFKEKLLEFCDVLDIPVVKTAIRKEDIITKLIDFLAAPRVMSDALISEKHQSSVDRKRKRSVKGTASKSGGASAKFSSRKRRKAEDTPKEKDKKSAPDTEIESEGDEDEKNDAPEEVRNHSENEDKEDESMESEEDMGEHKSGSKKSSSKKESAGKTNMKKCTTSRKATPTTSPRKTPIKASSKHSKVDDNSDKITRVFSRKKKNEETRKTTSNPVKSATKEKAGKKVYEGKKVVKGKDKSRGEEPGPSEDELRTAICEILQEVDFNTATFTDILKLLTQRFDTDLISRKSAIKLLIQEELTRLADEEEDNEDDKGAGDEKDQPTADQEVEA